MGKGPAGGKQRIKARVVERIIRCPRCGIKLAEASHSAHCRGVTIWCRRCRMPVELEL